MQKLSKAIKSSKPWSRDESMEILRSKFCALWRSWPPRRLDRSCSMASGSFGCSECCTLAVTRKCFELKGALKIAMHHRDLYRPSVLSKQEHKKSRKREAIQMIHDDSGRAWHVSGLAWFMSMSTCFFWIIQGRHCCQSRPESLHVQFQWWKAVRFFSWQVLACFGILWSCNSFIFDFVIGAKSPAVGADGPERT